jgi:PhzF family phenazine biosynthesis protein
MAQFIAGIIDVFADEPLEGNPLAVVEGADVLNDGQMRRIAAEFNQAETTFIIESRTADRRLRSFTAAGSEVFGAGHNALGAWLWLGENGRLGSLDQARIYHQEIGTDVLPIELTSIGGRVHGRMMQGPLRLPKTIVETCALAAALGLAVHDLAPAPPVQAADTGAAHLMVRAMNNSAVDRAKPNAEALLAVLSRTPADGCYLYAFDPASPHVAYARFFNPTVGLWEDAATGTAAGPLAAYLASSSLLPDCALDIEQGTKVGRRSIMRIRLRPEPELSGTGRIVLKGLLTI